MIISLAIHGHPSSSSSARSALRFLEAAVAAGHEVYRVFFYHEAVELADRNVVLPQDESPLLDSWVELAERHQVQLAICIAAALRRGVLNEEERDRYERPAANAHPAFEVVGLGQLIDAVVQSDRFVTFAA